MRWRVALLIALLSAPATAKRRGKATGSQVSSRKRECESECSDVDEDAYPDHRANCVLHCQSAACYVQVYKPEELEPGEIDLKRQREFQSCVSAENRKAIADRHKRRKDPDPNEEADGDEAQITNANVEL